MRYVCEKCKTRFSGWIYENGETVTNICVACYYKVVNQRELQIQDIVADVLEQQDLKAAIDTFNKLTYPDNKKKKKAEPSK